MKMKGWVVDAVHLGTRTARSKDKIRHFEPHDWPGMRIFIHAGGLVWSERRRRYVLPEVAVNVVVRPYCDTATFGAILDPLCRQRLAGTLDLGDPAQQWRIWVDSPTHVMSDLLEVGAAVSLRPAGSGSPLRPIRLGPIGRLLIA